MTVLLFDHFESPVGTILITAANGKLCSLDFGDYDERMQRLLTGRLGSFVREPTSDPFGFRRKIEAYFSGDLAIIDTIPVDTGGTAYQQMVWNALREIPLGTVSTYGALAKKIGSVARAVGITNSLNPVGIVVPCHRVIGADGTLTGYAGGLHRKEWLLRHEGVNLDALLSQKKRPTEQVKESHVQGAFFATET